MLAGMVLGGICAAAFGVFTPSLVLLWNTAWLALTSVFSSLRRYQ